MVARLLLPVEILDDIVVENLGVERLDFSALEGATPVVCDDHARTLSRRRPVCMVDIEQRRVRQFVNAPPSGRRGTSFVARSGAAVAAGGVPAAVEDGAAFRAHQVRIARGLAAAFDVAERAVAARAEPRVPGHVV